MASFSSEKELSAEDGKWENTSLLSPLCEKWRRCLSVFRRLFCGDGLRGREKGLPLPFSEPFAIIFLLLSLAPTSVEAEAWVYDSARESRLLRETRVGHRCCCHHEEAGK